MNDQENPWKTLSGEVKYDNPWINLTEYKVITPAGSEGIYGKVHFKNVAIGVIALDAEDHTYLVGQYRFPLDLYSWEIPEGGCPIGEDNLSTAKRELKEETGLEAKEWLPLCTFHLSNSVTDEVGQLFLARQLTAGESNPEETENLSVKKVSLDEALNQLEAGEITDAISIIGIYKLALMKAKGEL
jgi:8-oxo-dGTP pyrophosphatase MutT (NUDIX family)